MTKVYLYCDSRSLNEATNYYNGLVQRGLADAIGDYEFMVVNNLGDIKRPDYIYTITPHCFVLAKIRFPFAKTICWFQGIGYEEAKMTRPRWKWPLFKIEEWYAVNHADFLLFVSEKMVDYYKEYYGYKKGNYTIMPCYNLQQSVPFNEEQYLQPSFAYAGGLSKWQSVDVLLDVYSLVEKRIPGASLTLYCKTTAELERMIVERGIKNSKVLFVPIENLQEELHKHKYGFILREKNFVNLVATPTKMNSYLASYMIPIFSDGVDDFVKNITLGEFSLCAYTPLLPDRIAEMIIDFENRTHEYNDYKSIVDRVFESHYNDSTYISEISDKARLLFRI